MRARSYLFLATDRNCLPNNGDRAGALEHILRTISAGRQSDKDFVNSQRHSLREHLPEFAIIFLVTCIVLFLGMSLRPWVYDEGIILTAAMRVGAGQIPHRDFYANYGPAQFYILAGLFRIFGQSILVERLYDLLIKGLLVTAVFAIAASYTRRLVAACTAIVTVLWLFSLSDLTGTPVIPVSLLNVVGSALILPVFAGSVPTRRMLAAGALAGFATLFRYDTGLALFCIHTCVIAIAVCSKGVSNKLHALAYTWWPFALGFVVVTFPPLLYYLSVAPLHPFLHDIILYPSRYYHRGRNLPFPRVGPRSFEHIQVYLPIAAVGMSLYVAVAHGFSTRGNRPGPSRVSEEKTLGGFLVTFGLVAFVMYFKGYVRMEVAQMYLCIIPSLLLVAVLFQERRRFHRPLQLFTMAMAWLSVLAVASSTLHQIEKSHFYQVPVLEKMLQSRDAISPEIQMWCKLVNPLTRGLCFLPDGDRIRTIEFIDSHTTPGQLLYVGLTEHDRIFVNDNLIYFASQRLPATHWSHFDPGLQNSYAIQQEMVQELELNAPPYVVLDSEFDQMHEPNDSSRSTGVTLLDQYIHKTYQHTRSFGDMSIWRRVD